MSKSLWTQIILGRCILDKDEKVDLKVLNAKLVRLCKDKNIFGKKNICERTVIFMDTVLLRRGQKYDQNKLGDLFMQSLVKLKRVSVEKKQEAKSENKAEKSPAENKAGK